jgi:mannose-6-phosphate isomerase
LERQRLPTVVTPAPEGRRGEQTDAMDRERDERPWGSYEVLEDAPSHKVKRIEVRPHQRLSYQRHQRRAEHWFIVSGAALVTLDGTDHSLGAASAIDIPLGAAHRVANAGHESLVFIEVQYGDYFGEDDIERLEDDFGRAG